MPPKRKAASSKKEEGKNVKAKTEEKKKAPAFVRGKGKCYWLVKSEPESRFEKGIDMKFSVEDLKNEPKQTACWDGVRNYQARNILRDQMKVGDKAFFYHSNCKPPGIIAIVDIVKEGYPDYTQFDKKDPHYDPGSKESEPRWYMVDVKFDRMLKRYISLDELKSYKNDELSSMALLHRGRLSVQPVTEEEWNFILSLEK